jgi:hypothetical protein
MSSSSSSVAVLWPHTLERLMIDPSDDYLAVFLHQITEFIDYQVKAGRWAAFGLGDVYRAHLAQVVHAARPFRVLAILVYLVCAPLEETRRAAMHPKDRAFLRRFRCAVDDWLLGHVPNSSGDHYTEAHATHDGGSALAAQHTVGFVLGQMADYRYFFAHARANPAGAYD